MIIDSRHPLTWFFDCATLSEVRRALHTGYENTLRILDSEKIPVYRLAYGTRHRYYVDRDLARLITTRHGSAAARQRRITRSAARTKGTALGYRCPHCGQKGRQWRNGLNTAGNREVKCGLCKRCYTMTFGKLPPLQSTCPHCAASTRQWRQQVTSAGNLTVRCGHCRRHYTIPGNPDAALAPPDPMAAWQTRARPAVEQIMW